jgi:decaprenylphospho-beta-D-erythro-pentofuranosid-2-ulose 2-reductase
MNDALGSPQSVLVLGGSSDIARATVRALVARRCRKVILAGRNRPALQEVAEEASGLGATFVAVEDFDALDLEGVAKQTDGVFERHGDMDLVLVAVGVLGDQQECETDPQAAGRVIDTNFTGLAVSLLAVARRLREQGQGTIVVLSSVAGERARRANFVYGSSKAGLDAFCQGLADALVGSGVRMVIVRPGFVHSKMTAGMKPAPMSTTPEAVASAIVGGLASGQPVIWVPAGLRWVMATLRHLPRAVFRRIPS